MKKKNISQILSLLLFSLFILFACTPDDDYDEGPRFVNAKVFNETRDEVIVTFNQAIYTTSSRGFTIEINDTEVDIIELLDEGSRKLTFVIEKSVQEVDEVTISYSSTVGDAENIDGRRLRSFTKEEVENLIDKLELKIIVASIPPDVKNKIVWLILKTNESSSNWAWAHDDAIANVSLSAEASKTPFDLIVYIPNDNTWRSEDPFTNGYYATLLNQTSDNLQLKVISWQKDTSLAASDMGQLFNIYSGKENTTHDNAFIIATEGKDYTEGSINIGESLWYKFYATYDSTYVISINDSYSNSVFSGTVDAILYDKWELEKFPNQVIRSGANESIKLPKPSGSTDSGEYIWVKIKISERAGTAGNFQLQVIEQ